VFFFHDATPYEVGRTGAVASCLKSLIAGRNTVVVWEMRSRALELAGFMPGDIVLVDSAATPKIGDMVCVEIAEKNEPRCAMRIFDRAAPVNILVSRTLDPRLQKTIIFDGERVIVKGVLLPHRFRED
jgi:hypothetical protein